MKIIAKNPEKLINNQAIINVTIIIASREKENMGKKSVQLSYLAMNLDVICLIGVLELDLILFMHPVSPKLTPSG